ncbi:MAG: hypothetical protein EBV19_09555, partial [Flavobacteriia bacterium]|nr:hypothetical protein [Flavobacteriia bacterium]
MDQSGLFYLGDGVNDSDYLNIRANDVFDGCGYTITLSNNLGSRPANGLNGIFRAAGTDENNQATIRHVEIRVQLLFDNYQSSAIVGNYYQSDPDILQVAPTYVTLKDIILRCESVQLQVPLFSALLINGQTATPSNITIDSVCIFTDMNVQFAMNALVYQVRGYLTVSNTFINMNTIYGPVYSMTGCVVNITNCYFIYYDSSPIVGGLLFSAPAGTTVHCMNLYVMFLNASQEIGVRTGSPLLYDTIGGIIDVTNYYTNNDQTDFVIFDEPGSNGNNVNKFVWQYDPQLGTAFDTAITPYRLNVFMNPSIYD